ncbi:MAG: dienelactone hydrolase family protein [Streptosporangiaceae bacterium]
MTAAGHIAQVIAGAPALLRCQGTPEDAAQRGTVLFYHGFGGSKERPGAYLDAIASAGLLAVSVDAVGHGERRYPDFASKFSDERWDSQFDATESEFLQLIDKTAAEVPLLIDELLIRRLAVEGRIAVAGRSLGGNISYASLLADDRITAAVSVVGCPRWTLPRQHSPHLHPDQFYPAAVMSQAAEHDVHSPAEQIRDFHASLVPYYAADPERAECVEYLGVGHFLTPELDADSCQRLVSWCLRWLR